MIRAVVCTPLSALGVHNLTPISSSIGVLWLSLALNGLLSPAVSLYGSIFATWKETAPKISASWLFETRLVNMLQAFWNRRRVADDSFSDFSRS